MERSIVFERTMWHELNWEGNWLISLASDETSGRKRMENTHFPFREVIRNSLIN